MTMIKGYEMPDDLYYHPEHMWVRIDDDGNVTIGLTDFYVQMAGDTTYLDLPDEDDEIEVGETAGKVQSSKWVGKLIAPITGRIIEINTALEDDYLLVNKDSYGQGWIMRVEPSNLDKEIADLMHGTEALTPFLERAVQEAENS